MSLTLPDVSAVSVSVVYAEMTNQATQLAIQVYFAANIVTTITTTTAFSFV